MDTHVLLIEDDSAVRAMIRLLLEDEGYSVTEAATGDAGLRSFAGRPVDIAIVDLKLPDTSGFDVCRELRSRSDVPIVIVTAQVDSHDIVAGLEAGADDYVTKPFVPKVLLARIRALLRRSAAVPGSDGSLVLHDVVINPSEGGVTKGGKTVHLTKTELLLAVELATHAGQILSRDTLLERVWGYDFIGDGRLVDSHVRRLRAKLEDDPANPTLILTVRGLGYKGVA